MLLNEYGEIVMKCWDTIPGHFDNLETDEFIVMPNHIHGIIKIVGQTCVSALTTTTSIPNGRTHRANTQVRPYIAWCNGSKPCPQIIISAEFMIMDGIASMVNYGNAIITNT
jgi:hypothetical protein